MADYLSRTDTMELLDVSLKSVDALLSVGLLGTPTTVGRTVAIPRQEAQRLTDRPYANSDLPPLLLVKVRGAQPPENPDVDGRAWVGWNPDATKSDPDQIEAVRKYWRVSEPERYLGERLVVSTAGFPLAVYRIDRITTHPGKMREFHVSVDNTDIGNRIMGLRFPPQRGGPVELR